MQRITLVAAALTICTTSTCLAQEKMIKLKPMKIAKQQVKEEVDIKKLTIGDKAPPIDIAHWIKGKKVEEFEADKVYVVEFWATWCGPCIASMPHLSELQKKYADYGVEFISVSDEDLQTVISFLFKENKSDGKIQNDRIGYTLTTDPDESVKNDYFRAAGQRGIPCAFIIGKDTKIEWIGHPMSMDDPLEAVVRDTWDRDEAKDKFENAAANQKKLMAERQIFTKAMQSEDWSAATKASWDNANALNSIAWTIVDTKDVKNRDYKAALKAAKRANELTESKSGAIIDTLARVYYETGDLKTAIKWQRKAVEIVPDNTPMGEGIRDALKKYEIEADS